MRTHEFCMPTDIMPEVIAHCRTLPGVPGVPGSQVPRLCCGVIAWLVAVCPVCCGVIALVFCLVLPADIESKMRTSNEQEAYTPDPIVEPAARDVPIDQVRILCFHHVPCAGRHDRLRITAVKKHPYDKASVQGTYDRASVQVRICWTVRTCFVCLLAFAVCQHASTTSGRGVRCGGASGQRRVRQSASGYPQGDRSQGEAATQAHTHTHTHAHTHRRR